MMAVLREPEAAAMTPKRKRKLPPRRNPVARALRHVKPKVEPKATAYSRRRLGKPKIEDE
jgi:hypothetical protein